MAGIDDLKALHASLGELLADPAPGLLTWKTMLSETLMEMACYAGHGHVTAFPDLLAACEAALPFIVTHHHHRAGDVQSLLQGAISKAKGTQ